MVAGSDAEAQTRITPSALRRARRAGKGLLDSLGAMKVVLLSKVPQRFHAITDELAKFGTIGVINLGVNFAVFNLLLVVVSESQVKAKAFATIVATTCAYFLNRYWTYRHRPKSTLRREYSLFFLFNAVGLVIETGIVAIAKYGFDQTSLVILNICTFIGIGLGTVFRFWAYRTHVFKDEPAPEAALASSPVAAVRPIVVNGALPVGLRDEELRDELVQLELDDLLDRDRTDPSPRH